MVRLLGKSQFDPKNKIDIAECSPDLHTFWTLSSKFSEPLARIYSRRLGVSVWWDELDLVTTTNTTGWHQLARDIGDEPDTARFLPLLLAGVPDLFKDLPRTMHNGTLVIRR